MSTIQAGKCVSKIANNVNYPYPIETKLGLGFLKKGITEYSFNQLSIIVENKEVASEIYQKKNNLFLGLEMKSLPEYRQKGYRFGEILRLFSIVELIQEGLDAINIISRPSAAIFHKKYKFQSDLFMKDAAKMVMNQISRDNLDKELEPVNKKAKNCIFGFNLLQANEILDEYLSIIADKNLSSKAHILNCGGIPMKLTLENINKNSDFFNTLFKKHKIDFKI